MWNLVVEGVGPDWLISDLSADGTVPKESGVDHGFKLSLNHHGYKKNKISSVEQRFANRSMYKINTQAQLVAWLSPKTILERLPSKDRLP